MSDSGSVDRFKNRKTLVDSKIKVKTKRRIEQENQGIYPVKILK